MTNRDMDRKIKQMTITAVFTAMMVVLSLSIFSIPVPGGHLYFCDTVINIAAILLGPAYAFVVGGIGSFLGDFFFYPAPMFVSLVTHGLQAVVVSIISHKLLQHKQTISSVIAVIIGAVIMVIGYTAGRAYVYATPAVSMTKLPFEILQATFGAVVSIVVCYPMRLRKIYSQMVYI